jgi:hypothetical protein
VPKFLFKGKKKSELYCLIFSIWISGKVKFSLFYKVVLEYFILIMTRLFASCCDTCESLTQSLFGVNFDDYENDELGSLYISPHQKKKKRFYQFLVLWFFCCFLEIFPLY